MPDARPAPRTIPWLDYFPWLLLGRALRATLTARVLLAALIGYLGTKAGWQIVGRMFSGTENARLLGWIELASPWPWNAPRAHGVVPDWPEAPGWLLSLMSGPVVLAWNQLTVPFRAMFDPVTGWQGVAYGLLCGLWALLVWAFFGGIIARSAAVRITRNDPSTLGHCVYFTNRKLFSFFAAPLFPLLGIALLAVPLIVAGLLAQLEFGALVVGVLGFLVVLLAVMMALLYLALGLGWPLMWATIAVEGTDAFDALSRTYAYVYQRPLKMLFYVVVAAILGAVGFVFVWLFAGAVGQMAVWGLSLGAGYERMASELLAPAAPTGGRILQFWLGLVTLAAASFPIAYLWCAFVGVYVLLRRDVDAAELDEVYLDEVQESYGLPHLRTTPPPAAAEDDPLSPTPVDETPAPSPSEPTITPAADPTVTPSAEPTPPPSSGEPTSERPLDEPPKSE